MLLKSAIRLASGRTGNARLSVLVFHRVLPKPDPLFPGEVDVVAFDRILGWLTDWFRLLPLDEAIRRLGDGSLPKAAAAITFDDGYADNLLHAAPLLARHGAPATLFVATGFLDGGRMWNDTVIEAVRRSTRNVIDLGEIGIGPVSVADVAAKRAALARVIPAIKHRPPKARQIAVDTIRKAAAADLPGDLMMTREQVRAWHGAGLGLGAHTVNHPILARLETDAARREMADSRAELEAIVDDRIGLFAYPNGKPGQDYTADHAALAAELGFDAALSTHWGAADADSDRYQLPRFTPWDRSRTRFGIRMLRNLAGV